MIFMYSPERRDDTLEISRFGDTVIVNGAPLDLSLVPDGCSLPRGAIDCIYINGSVERQNGIISVPWSVPIPANADEDAAFPPLGVSIQENGPVQLPGLPEPVGLPPTEPAIAVDLSRLITPAKILAAARDAAYLTRREFARGLALAEIIPFSEATAFATGMALPSKAQAYIDTLPEAARDLAVFTILTADTVHRNDPHVRVLASQEQIPAAVMDYLFHIGPAPEVMPQPQPEPQPEIEPTPEPAPTEEPQPEAPPQEPAPQEPQPEPTPDPTPPAEEPQPDPEPAPAEPVPSEPTPEPVTEEPTPEPEPAPAEEPAPTAPQDPEPAPPPDPEPDPEPEPAPAPAEEPAAEPEPAPEPAPADPEPTAEQPTEPAPEAEPNTGIA